MTVDLIAFFARKPASTGASAQPVATGSPAKRPVQLFLLMLIALALPCWAAEPRELDWPALIPEGAPIIPPQLTPLHDMSQLSNALSV